MELGGGGGNDIVVMDSEGSIKGEVVPLPQTNTKTCTKAKNRDAPTPSSSSDDVTIKNVLDISFPRCSVCQTEWFSRQIEDDGNNEDEKLPSLTSSDYRKRKHQHTRHRETLFPMPKCGCSTRLALPHNLQSAIFSSSNESTSEHPIEVLSKVQTHTFPNLAICGSCLKCRIKTSEEVLEHDYRQQHIPNGQQNVKFTVNPNCVQCKQKFMPRVLERLLQSEEGAKPEKKKESNKKKKGEDVNWYDAVDTTIQLVGWAKCESYRERRKLRQYKRAKKMNHISCVEGGGDNNNEQKIECWWNNQNGFTGGDTGSSDECYSLPSDSSVGDDSDDDNYSKRRKGVHRLAAKKGEICQELMQKDPKFRQEVEDAQVVKKLLEEENERLKEAEARAKRDHEMAMKLQAELDKQTKQSIEPIKTRRSKNNPIASDPFSHASASAKKKGEKKSKHQQTEPQSTAIASAARAQTNHDTSTRNEDDDINHLLSMGFTEASSRRCLKDAQGDIERAVKMLLSGNND